ncbi:MAG: SLOG family protein [Burkholderiales bacterium]|nr:SLOG family protein [Burkholderiales bacterium]
MTTAIICGGRSYGIVPKNCPSEDYTRYQKQALRERERLSQILREAAARLGVTKMVMGDQTGADSLASRWCEGNGMAFQVYAAEWEVHGSRAGPIRNLRMIKEEVPMPTICIAFPGSRGTRDMVAKADGHFMRVIKVDWT